MEEAEGLLGREMRDREEEVQTNAGAGGQSNEHINTPPSNELSNAPSSNVHINASLRKTQQYTTEQRALQCITQQQGGGGGGRWSDS